MGVPIPLGNSVPIVSVTTAPPCTMPIVRVVSFQLTVAPKPSAIARSGTIVRLVVVSMNGAASPVTEVPAFVNVADPIAKRRAFVGGMKVLGAGVMGVGVAGAVVVGVILFSVLLLFVEGCCAVVVVDRTIDGRRIPPPVPIPVPPLTPPPVVGWG